MSLSLQQCADTLSASLRGDGDTQFNGAHFDSRLLKPGQLFVAVPGQQRDGHDFVNQAAAAGAAAALVSHPIDTELPQLVVADTVKGLGQIARLWRDGLNAKVVAVTGSNGKTTVKEMTTSILRRAGSVCTTQGNYNNELGVPLTLLEATENDDFVVLEMGARQEGDIAYLCHMAHPNVALITNIAIAHLERFGSLETTARTKGEILANLAPGGIGIVNGDEPFMQGWREQFQQSTDASKLVCFGQMPGCVAHCQATDQRPLQLMIDERLVEVDLALPGRHNGANATAAATIAWALGISHEKIIAGLEQVQAVSGRLRFLATRQGTTVVDDSYNANPASLAAAIEVATSECPRVHLVLGDMKELGVDEKALHRAAGQNARGAGIASLFSLGELAAEAAAGFGGNAHCFASQDELVEAVLKQTKAGDCILIKGSRSMAMENVVEAVMAGRGGAR